MKEWLLTETIWGKLRQMILKSRKKRWPLLPLASSRKSEKWKDEKKKGGGEIFLDVIGDRSERGEGLEEGYRFINVLRKLNMERHLTLNLNTIESHLAGNKKADNWNSTLSPINPYCIFCGLSSFR